ncbi:MAG: hypothetical protein M1833_006723 [Piccolia ochrophora]|nr:MAG: hypothetical protein M1833_006723 [Piccolia ochrophora]
MNSSPYGQSPAIRSPARHAAPQPHSSSLLRRTDSSSSDSSTSSKVTTLAVARHAPHGTATPGQGSRVNANFSPPNPVGPLNFSRPNAGRALTTERIPSRSPPGSTAQNGHHQATPQHSQGFFEPSLPTASYSNQGQASNLTASQIAAQAAMQHQASQQHLRKRSQTIPSPNSPTDGSTGRRKLKSPPPIIATGSAANGKGSPGVQQYQNGLLGGQSTTAATAANAAYPRNALSSPAFPPPLDNAPPLPSQEPKQKSEKSKMKLFSKPKNIGISKDKDLDKKDRALPSPNKTGFYSAGSAPRGANASTTSLADSLASGAPPTLYATANNSTSTLVHMTEKGTGAEKHKHHFLSRQKHKHKDKEEHRPLPLSSASSNSRPLDPHAPQSLYSFVPSSPGPTTNTFAKSMSGFDLRHGGRALREKKKEEKASAAGTTSSITPGYPIGYRDEDTPTQVAEWGSLAGQVSNVGQQSLGTPGTGGMPAFSVPGGGYVDAFGQSILQGYGLQGMTPDDAWPFLKAKLLVIFEGEDLRLPVEDLNRLVVVHIQRCVQKRSPHDILDDVRDLLETGFSSLEQTLRATPDERLIPQLVDMWLVVFGAVLPYMEAVFLPLNLEFKGRGTVLKGREAQEFWGMPAVGESESPLADTLDVRRIVLLSYRDLIILPRHDTLKTRFSRLSLESINGMSDALSSSPDGSTGGRPGTAASLDPGLASFNSQGSTLLNDSSASAGARSRATSNTSSAFGAASSTVSDTLLTSPPQIRPVSTTPLPMRANAMESTRITETVARMLQCVSVLASLQSGDDAQTKMEDLAKALKHNWLGRGRTGRNRRGFVGTKLTGPKTRGGSPTPTPSTFEDSERTKSSL